MDCLSQDTLNQQIKLLQLLQLELYLLLVHQQNTLLLSAKVMPQQLYTIRLALVAVSLTQTDMRVKLTPPEKPIVQQLPTYSMVIK